MMKRISIRLGLLVVLTILISCTKSTVLPGFEDMKQLTIYDYLATNKADYSSFLSILEVGGIDKTLSAYNPNGVDYTLFLPNNAAVDQFIKESGQYLTLDDLLKDKTYVEALARYHVVNEGTSSYNFPFGAFEQPTLSDDFLNVNFIFGQDTTYYKINNQANVIVTNIELSNGYIHQIETMLKPITLNSYGWLKLNPAYSILTAAIEATGYREIIDVDMKLKDQTLKPFTMLVESDEIYKMRNINSFEDLAKEISPERTDYTDPSNPLNLFVGYHMLNESKFLNDFEGRSTNYNTFADVPLSINGIELDIIINKGKEEFAMNGDTTDFVGLYYDSSNVVTQSGAIHFINQILKTHVPSQEDVTFEFYDELFLNEMRRKGGTYLIEDHESMDNVTWSGAKLYYVKSIDDSEPAWSNDCMLITGDFSITYQIPKIIQGKYDVYFQADAYSTQNALVELYVDGIKLGGLIDLTKGGNATWPYFSFMVGSIDFKKYASHSIEIRSLIPGRLKWDYISFRKQIK